MENNIVKKQCTGCESCVAVCPKKCIKMKSDEIGFMYPVISLDDCINCGLCREVCSIYFENENLVSSQKAYAAFAKDLYERQNSSSGGLFSILAKYIIDNNGVVFGAAFNKSYTKVCHVMVDNIDDLYRLRGSKYLQSNIGDIYSVVKENLNLKKKVLFSGTPCQIFGLKKYLRMKYDNLFLIEVACHGVPSQFVWKEYIGYLERKYKSKVKYVNFRCKNPSWQQYDVKIAFDNGKCYQKRGYDDLYMRGFIQNMYLRPSCYSCKHKINNSCADVTLADFWGIQQIISEYNDDKGVSLVVTHTKQGDYLLEKIKNEINIKEVELKMAIEKNPSISTSAAANSNSKEFLSKTKEISIYKLLKKYCDRTFVKKLFKNIKKLIRKFMFKTRKIK